MACSSTRASRSDLLEFVGVGIFPIANQFSLIGKFRANVEVDSPGGSRERTDITYGIGVQFDMGRNLALRALWQRYDTDPDEVDWIAIGAAWRF